MGATVAPEKILRELADLWVTLGKQGEPENSAGVLRACAMTLVVLAEESEDVTNLGETIAALMPEHPARAILIRLRASGERSLGERVYAQCWMPFGQRRQICCEQIEITASDAALEDLPSVLLPLVVADLPVILWCRSARLVEMPAFGEMARMVTRVVVDSGGSAHGGDGRAMLQRLAAEVERDVAMGDLAWTRLTRWREMLALVFENQKNLERLHGMVQVGVRSGTTAISTTALYMAAWVKDALETAGLAASVTIGTSEAGSIELISEGLEVRVERRDNRMVTTVDGLAQCTKLPAPSDYSLMREELRITARDPIFEKALASAARLAYATDK